MGTVISNLKARFGVDTNDFKKGLKDGESALNDFKGSGGSILDNFASMFGVNMGAVNDAVGTANKSLGLISNSLIGVAKGGNIATISMNLFKWAMVATGIGALIVALGTLMAYFMKTGEGTDKFAKILMQIKSVVNDVIERLAVFGKGLWEILTGKFKQGWEDMKGAFKGMGTEIKEDWKAAGDLADRFDALEDREIQLIKTLEERKAKAAELRQLAKEETEDQKKKLDMLNQAEKLYKSVYGDQISLEQERLTLMKEQLAMQTKDPTDEQRRSVAEQEAKISALYRQQAEELKALNREKKTALAIVAEQLALEKQKVEDLKNGIKQIDISNIKMPDFNQIADKIIQPLKNVNNAISKTMVDIGESVKKAFEAMAISTGEFLGALAVGDESVGNFGKVIQAAFADLLTNIGTAMIAAGVAKIKFDSLMLVFGGGFGIIAAGIALVAFGRIMKGSLKGATTASSGSDGSGGGNSFTYNAAALNGNKQTLQLAGEVRVRISGNDLVGVLNNENIRKKATT